jgi:putative endonuclease
MDTKTKRDVGDEAETLVVEHYEREGWVVRDRNVLSRRGEVDIVAEKGVQLAFVEVRMRATDVWGDPSMTVGRSKQRKVVLAALQYLQRQRLMNRAIQFDVASVVTSAKSGEIRSEHLRPTDSVHLHWIFKHHHGACLAPRSEHRSECWCTYRDSLKVLNGRTLLIGLVNDIGWHRRECRRARATPSRR